MHPEQAKPTNQTDQTETAFIGELQRFTDPRGGAPLDAPEVRARPQRRPSSLYPEAAPADGKDTPPAK